MLEKGIPEHTTSSNSNPWPLAIQGRVPCLEHEVVDVGNKLYRER